MYVRVFFSFSFSSDLVESNNFISVNELKVICAFN